MFEDTMLARKYLRAAYTAAMGSANWFDNRITRLALLLHGSSARFRPAGNKTKQQPPDTAVVGPTRIHLPQATRLAALELKKSERQKEEAVAALEAAREELKVCQLVVDEGSEAARLREQVIALKADLDAKSRAATAGWDAAAGAESEAAAAEARGLQAGLKRGRSDADKKARDGLLLCENCPSLLHRWKKGKAVRRQ